MPATVPNDLGSNFGNGTRYIIVHAGSENGFLKVLSLYLNQTSLLDTLMIEQTLNFISVDGKAADPKSTIT